MAEIAAQDLSAEPLLQRAGRDTGKRPLIAGIPLLYKLGQGSVGAVFRAVHPMLDRQLAVRVLELPNDPKSERFARFLGESKNALTLESPHTVEVYDVGTEGGVFFYVMEYVHGKSAQEHVNHLRERLRPGMKEIDALDTAIAAVTGLSSAHNVGVAHLDIHPSSILIPYTSVSAPTSPETSGTETLDYSKAKLSDFGLAFNDYAAQQFEGTRALTGTPGFMSPEQTLGDPDAGKACDIFAMGATFYNLMAGQPPFGGLSLTIVMSSTVVQDVVDIRTWRPDVSRATARLIQICLQKNPKTRFEDANTLLQALKICRAAMNEPMEGQLAAIDQIEKLVKVKDEPKPVAPPMDSSPATEATMIGSSISMPAGTEDLVIPASVPAPAQRRPSSITNVSPPRAGKSSASRTPAVSGSRTPNASGPRVPAMDMPAINRAPIEPTRQDFSVGAPPARVSAAAPPPPPPPRPPTRTEAKVPPLVPVVKEWEDPTLQVTEEAPEPSSKAPVLVLLMLLVLAAAGGAWKLGYIPIGQKTPIAQPTPPVVPAASPEDEQKKKDLEAMALAEAETKRLAEAERVKQEEAVKLLEKTKLEDEARKLAEAKKKEEDDKKKVEAETKAKAEEALKAVEAAKLKEEEDKKKREAEAKAKADEEVRKIAAAAKLKEEEEKKKLDAEAKAKADEEAHKVADAAKAKLLLEEEQTKAGKAARELKALAAENKLPQTYTVDFGNNIKIEFVLVPRGAFMMGTDRTQISELVRRAGANEKDYADESPAHKVDLAPFYIAKTPLTVAQFRHFATAAQYQTAAERRGEAYTLQDKEFKRVPGASWLKPGFEQGDDHPVVMLNLRDCESVTAWAAKQTGVAMRLPTEAEWEYAARGPRGPAFPWGDEWNGKLANHSDTRLKPFAPADWNCSTWDDGFPFTSPAGAFNNPSWCGALDMSGNVFQWCSDIYQEYPQSDKAPRIDLDPADMPKDTKRVLRGGSFLFRPIDCRAATRRSSSPRAWSCEFGMRLTFTPGE